MIKLLCKNCRINGYYNCWVTKQFDFINGKYCCRNCKSYNVKKEIEEKNEKKRSFLK